MPTELDSKVGFNQLKKWRHVYSVMVLLIPVSIKNSHCSLFKVIFYLVASTPKDSDNPLMGKGHPFVAKICEKVVMNFANHDEHICC